MRTEDLIVAIREAWGWKGLQPAEIVEINDFGNVLVRDTQDAYWRICPEELSCEIVVRDDLAYAGLKQDLDFLRDWEMEQLVTAAAEELGRPGPGRCYCLKIPGALGGEYTLDNMATIDSEELLRASGDLGRQIEDLPDGTEIELTVTE